MKHIEITCEAQAIIEERWTLTVPDDFDITDTDAVWDAFHNGDERLGVDKEFIDDRVLSDETDRTITRWYVLS
jgi:hypothetical protein